MCEHCGAQIAVERLEAIPYATRCIDCQRLAERA
jgi:RNA polymerase-binding transcription factor DksA